MAPGQLGGVRLVGGHEAQPTTAALGQREADPRDPGERDQVGQQAPRDLVDVLGVAQREAEAREMAQGRSRCLPLGVGGRRARAVHHGVSVRQATPGPRASCADVDTRPAARGSPGTPAVSISQNDPVGTQGKRAGSRRAPKKQATLSPGLLGLAVGVTLAVVAWGYLVYAAIDFGSSARGGDSRAWWFLAVASVGAVACLFVGLMLVARLLRRLGIAAPRPGTAGPAGDPHPDPRSHPRRSRRRSIAPPAGTARPAAAAPPVGTARPVAGAPVADGSQRSVRRRTNFRPDQTTSTAATFTSTKPSSRPRSRT